MAKTYKVEVQDLQTVAYIRAILVHTVPGQCSFDRTVRQKVESFFPGGVSAAANEETLLAHGDRREVINQLNAILERAGITNTSAPWLKPQAPTEIDGNEITYKDDGIHIGCKVVSWAEYDAIGEKRPGVAS